MADRKRVYLHIGAPKTGTTFLQQLLFSNRDRLADQGVLYPSLGLDAHHTAAWSLRPDSGGGVDGSRFRGVFERLVAMVNEWQGHTVVISTEMFVFFGPELARRVLTAFGDAEVHVIYTARDLVRQVPAVWQEQVKNQKTQGYRTFLLDLVGPRITQLARHFWRAQDAPRALERWSHGLPPHHVHVVTAPPSGASPSLLWERFASVIGVEIEGLDTTMSPANESLGVAASEVLRRYNARHGDAVPLQQYRRQMLRPLMPALVAGVNDDSKLPLSRRQRRLLVRRCEHIARDIRDAGYDVVGSLDELVPADSGQGVPRRGGKGPANLSDKDVVDALLDVVHHLLQEQRGNERQRRRGRAG